MPLSDHFAVHSEAIERDVLDYEYVANHIDLLDVDDLTGDECFKCIYRLLAPRLLTLRGIDLGETDLDLCGIDKHSYGGTR